MTTNALAINSTNYTAVRYYCVMDNTDHMNPQDRVDVLHQFFTNMVNATLPLPLISMGKVPFELALKYGGRCYRVFATVKEFLSVCSVFVRTCYKIITSTTERWKQMQATLGVEDLLDADIAPEDLLDADIAPEDLLDADIAPEDLLDADIAPEDLEPIDVKKTPARVHAGRNSRSHWNNLSLRIIDLKYDRSVHLCVNGECTVEFIMRMVKIQLQMDLGATTMDPFYLQMDECMLYPSQSLMNYNMNRGGTTDLTLMYFTGWPMAEA
jgi:hypothetical protein